MGDVFIWAAVDETTDYVGRFIVNILPGKLNTEVPSNPQLICSKVRDHTNHSNAARFVNDGFKMLWHIGVHEEKALIMYSDAEAYML
jgi:hypothetical protein